jgi:hypothetical protein
MRVQRLCAARRALTILTRAMLLGSTVFCSMSVSALTRTWPGAVPCDGTLQNCISASVAGDAIEIVTNTPINEAVFSANAISISASPGWQPRFAVGREIIFATESGGAIRIAGLRLPGGRIWVSHGGSDALTIDIERNDLGEPTPVADPFLQKVLVQCPYSSDCTARVRFNRIVHSRGGEPEDNAAIKVLGPVVASSGFYAEISGNELLMTGGLNGIVIEPTPTGRVEANSSNVLAANFQALIESNTIRGGSNASILIRDDGDIGYGYYRLRSNLITGSARGRRDAGGLRVALRNLDGDANFGFVDMLRNTVVDASCGICATADSVADSLSFARGVLAYNQVAAVLPPSGSAPIVDTLVWHNAAPINGGQSNVIEADPRFIDRFTGRAAAGSPLIDRGDEPGADGETDADGLLRTQGSSSDWGAIENGGNLANAGPFETARVREHVATAANILGRVTRTNDFEARRRWMMTPSFSPWQRGVGAINAQPIGLQYVNGTWGMRNLVDAPMPVNAAFHVFSPVFNDDSMADGMGVHVASATNSTGTFTELTANTAIGAEQKIFVTQAWNPSGTAVDNPNHIGVLLFGSDWFVINQGAANIPIGAAFFVYHQRESRNVYTHVARGANVAGGQTTLEHPLLNGIACAAPLVTLNLTPNGISNPHPIAVGYLGERWYVANQDGTSMPTNVAFNVLIDPKAVERCGDHVFANGFDD